MLKAIFFGVPQIYHNHDALTGTLSGCCLALFAYLALANQPQDRGHLADLLWSEIGEQQARQNLRLYQDEFLTDFSIQNAPALRNG